MTLRRWPLLPLLLLACACLPERYSAYWLKPVPTVLRAPAEIAECTPAETTPEKLENIKTEIFHEYLTELLSSMVIMTEVCLIGRQSPDPQQFKHCQEEYVKALTQNFVGKSKSQSGEHCYFWTHHGQELDVWGKLAAQELQVQQDAARLSLYTLDSFRKERDHLLWAMSSECDPRAIYFAVFNHKRPQHQFDKKLQRCRERFRGTHPQTFLLVSTQMQHQYTFPATARMAEQDLQHRMGDMDLVIAQSAQELIEQCRQSPWHKPSFHPFHAGSLYVRPEVLGCINNELPRKLDQMLTSKLGTDYTKATRALVYLEHKYLPTYLDQLQLQLQKIHAVESVTLAANDLTNDDKLWEKLYLRHVASLHEHSKSFFLACQQLIKSDIAATLQKRVEKKDKALTLAYHEEATIVAQEYCFRFKSKKSMETSAELAKIEEDLKGLVVPTDYQWFAKIRGQGLFLAGCRENIQADIALQVNHLIKQTFRHFTKEKILSIALDKMCQDLKTDFVAAIDEFDTSLDELDLPQKYAKVIQSNLGWTLEKEQEKMQKVCEDDHAYALSGQNLFRNHPLLSSNVKAVVLAHRICQLANMAWLDLKQGAAQVEVTCFQGCWDNLRAEIAEYFVVLPDSLWARLDDQREQGLIKKLVVQLNQMLDEQIQQCKQQEGDRGQCLTTQVFYPQNFSNLVSKIYPAGKKINPEHLAQMDASFKQKSKLYAPMTP